MNEPDEPRDDAENHANAAADPAAALAIRADGREAQDGGRFVGVAGRSIAEAPMTAASPRPLVSLASPHDLDAEDAFPGMTALGPVPSERKARDWALVLQSMSVWHAIRRSNLGWMLLVRDEDYARSAEAVDSYETENRDWPPRPIRERPRHAPSALVPAMFAALLAFFLVTGPEAGHSGWFSRGAAVSNLVLSSAPFRAVTALTLHGDAIHVLGNAISGTIFALPVQRRLGAGGGALAILVSGILGNFANAFYHRGIGDGMHASIGASTAIMGAIGILAATQVALDRPERTARRHWTEIVGPIIGGFALLGALGAGDPAQPGRVDLGAHLFGFLAGLVVGLAAALPLRRRGGLFVGLSERHAVNTVALGAAPQAWVQAALGAVATAIIVVAWQLAIRR